MGTDEPTEAYVLMKSFMVLAASRCFARTEWRQDRRAASRQSRQSRLLQLLLALLTVTQAPVTRAQTLLSRDEQNVANFAFATQLGSGVYSVSGRTLQIYRLPFSHTLKSADDSGFGIELTLPLTFGFYDFEVQDIANAGIPTNVDALSFVPGLTLTLELQPGWTLEPYVEAGIARAREVEADSRVFSGGLRSLYTFDGLGFDWLLRNDLTFAGVDLRGAEGANRFARFQTVLTARQPFARRSSVDYLVYALNEYYVDQPDGPVDSAERGGSSMQYEIGLTFGTSEPQRIWRIPVPRFGIGYRFGSDLDVFRIVIGTPF